MFVRARCDACHPAPTYTDRAVHDVGLTSDTDHRLRFDTPSLRECYRTAPYLHDGRAKTLAEIFASTTPGTFTAGTGGLSEQELEDLLAFLRKPVMMTGRSIAMLGSVVVALAAFGVPPQETREPTPADTLTPGTAPSVFGKLTSRRWSYGHPYARENLAPVENPNPAPERQPRRDHPFDVVASADGAKVYIGSRAPSWSRAARSRSTTSPPTPS